jgi:hypothetical protein
MCRTPRHHGRLFEFEIAWACLLGLAYLPWLGIRSYLSLSPPSSVPLFSCTGIARFTFGLDIVGPSPVPTGANIFRFPPRRATDLGRRATDAPTRVIASKIEQNRQWRMPSLVITKVETRVSISITVLLHDSRIQPAQLTHEFSLSMTTRSHRGSGIGWIADSFEKSSQVKRYPDRWLTLHVW